MSRGLHLRFESLGRDDYSEVRFSRSTILHGFVVRMQMGVVVDL